MFSLVCVLCVSLALAATSADPYVIAPDKGDSWYSKLLTAESGLASPCGNYSGDYDTLFASDPELAWFFVFDEGKSKYRGIYMDIEVWQKAKDEKGDLRNMDGVKALVKVDNLPEDTNGIFQSLYNDNGTLVDFIQFPVNTLKDRPAMISKRTNETDTGDKFDSAQYKAFDLPKIFGDKLETFKDQPIGDDELWKFEWEDAFAVPVVMSSQFANTTDVGYPYQCAYVLLIVVAGKYQMCCLCCKRRT